MTGARARALLEELRDGSHANGRVSTSTDSASVDSFVGGGHVDPMHADHHSSRGSDVRHSTAASASSITVASDGEEINGMESVAAATSLDPISAARAHKCMVQLASPLLPGLMEVADMRTALLFVPW